MRRAVNPDLGENVDEETIRRALCLTYYFMSHWNKVFAFLERSEFSTGNANADNILVALAAAGREGLTKEMIRKNVFKGHKTSLEIDNALDELHRRNLAHRASETGRGRSATRWFFGPGKA